MTQNAQEPLQFDRPDNAPCDLRLVADALQVAQLADGIDVDISAFIRVWHELNRFMRRLGFAFKFVVDDVTQKTDTLAMYMRSEARAHYRTGHRVYQRVYAIFERLHLHRIALP